MAPHPYALDYCTIVHNRLLQFLGSSGTNFPVAIPSASTGSTSHLTIATHTIATHNRRTRNGKCVACVVCAVQEDSLVYSLKCNISQDVNYLHQGIALGLVEDRWGLHG
jgi:hypothetical protein